jgi:ubiquinone/menaquinone biosynthesis C-methylase UbiE
MADYTTSINNHYGQPDLSLRILTALQDTGKDLKALTRDDLAPFDEFHGGGRNSTRELAGLAGVDAGMHVLDVGSGIGGPARTLAAEFGCRVTGIDLTAEFCRAAEMLTSRVGLSDRVTFRRGNALGMPFEDGTFDVVWTQNTLMNIADKGRLAYEMHRVLRPGGCLALEAIMAGPVSPIHFPVFWASNPALSFLSPPAEIRQLLIASGFTEIAWENVTPRAIEMSRRRRATAAAEDPSPLGIHVIVAADVAEKTANSLRNFEEGRTIAVQAVFERS